MRLSTDSRKHTFNQRMKKRHKKQHCGTFHSKIPPWTYQISEPR